MFVNVYSNIFSYFFCLCSCTVCLYFKRTNINKHELTDMPDFLMNEQNHVFNYMFG
ncbi:hypothetical protein Hanom_Chr12g01084761 [Helianthus anomalus]